MAMRVVPARGTLDALVLGRQISHAQGIARDNVLDRRRGTNILGNLVWLFLKQQFWQACRQDYVQLNLGW